ncbi:MAG: acyl-CoA carboxylase subunit beta [Deltaproteobacteria bacterium]|nr:acyl-CoA carboxylase subunit beta [Deltaproteobacteria bacterium]
MEPWKPWHELLAELKSQEERALQGGGPSKQQAQLNQGKLLCRGRVEALLDAGSFHEINALAETQTFEFNMQQKKILGDGVVTGFGAIEGRKVLVYAQDVTVFGGSAGRAHGEKINLLLRLARQVGAPVIGLYESAGGRLQDGMQNESGYGQMFFENTQCSGVVPQIAAVMGACTGGGVYSPALMDFIVQVKNTAPMFITGPGVIKEVTGEEISFEDLGGTAVHANRSGVTHLVARDDLHCCRLIRQLLSYLPANNRQAPPLVACSDDPERSNDVLTQIVPADPANTYDMRLVIREIVDRESFFEIQPTFAKNMLVGFARLQGQSVGVVANQPRYLGGVIDVDGANKAARFIRFCDCFTIPLLILADVPGYMPGSDQEKKGIIRHGAKMLYAFSEATVPKVTVVLRKYYGGAIPAMCCHETGADFLFAWPTAEFAMIGAKAAVPILYRKEIAQAADPEKLRQEKAVEYKETIMSPYYAASKQYIDGVIHPRDTRRWLNWSFDLLRAREPSPRPWKKHGNIPL